MVYQTVEKLNDANQISYDLVHCLRIFKSFTKVFCVGGIMFLLSFSAGLVCLFIFDWTLMIIILYWWYDGVKNLDFICR